MDPQEKIGIWDRKKELISISFFFFSFFGLTHGILSGQESKPSHRSDNTRFLTTRPPGSSQEQISFQLLCAPRGRPELYSRVLPPTPGPKADLGATAGCVHSGLLPVPCHAAARLAHLKFLQVGPPPPALSGGSRAADGLSGSTGSQPPMVVLWEGPGGGLRGSMWPRTGLQGSPDDLPHPPGGCAALATTSTSTCSHLLCCGQQPSSPETGCFLPPAPTLGMGPLSCGTR